MRKFFHQAKASFDNLDKKPAAILTPTTIGPPTPNEIARYRYQHGANLGSVFVLERWLTGHMFPETSDGSSELAAAQAWIREEGIEAARRRFERHWASYVSDADLDWLAHEAHCTSVRLPIGYFTLGPEFCARTAFAGVADLYVNAWSAVEVLIARCWTRGIGVLVDLHALPGGANEGEHSGTNSGKAEFWDSRKNRELATRCLVAITQRARAFHGVVGIQLCNEAEGAAPKKGMYEWYDQVLSALKDIDQTVPLYISDAWDLAGAVEYSNKRNGLRTRLNPLVIDDHLYWCFSDDDKAKHPQQIYGSDVPGTLKALDGHSGNVFDHGAAQVVIGEYSCVLADQCWASGGGEGSKTGHVRAFGQAQCERHRAKTGGSFFWTYKMDWMDGGEWGFKQQTSVGAISAPDNLALSCDEVEARLASSRGKQAERLGQLKNSHCRYWDSQPCESGYEHHRFEHGLSLGFEDGAAFFGGRARGQMSRDARVGGDKIGMLDVWVLKRMREAGEFGTHAWEFEAGLRQGLAAFQELVGI